MLRPDFSKIVQVVFDKERIEFEQHFPLVGGNMQLDQISVPDLRRLVFRVRSFLLKKDWPVEETTEFVTVPADWWQHFKERWFPRWALNRWPVLTRKITVRTTRIERRMCPHPAVKRDDSAHFEWLVRREPPQPCGRCPDCGATDDDSHHPLCHLYTR